MEPEVSVVIPSYNHEAYVNEAVASALACDQLALEVVVVDDGSTDGSREALRVWDAEPRVRVFLQDNRGAHAALNRGLDLARGDLVFILNSDDAFEPDRLVTLGERLRANPDAAVAASWIRVVDAAGAELGIKQAWHTLPPWPPNTGARISDLGDPRLAMLETNWISTTSNLAFPRRAVVEHGLSFQPLRFTHDWDFILAACHVGAIVLIEAPLVRYRVHGANTIGEGVEAGRGTMRFEIMWTLARHAMRIIRAAAGNEAELVDLRSRFLNSAPAFGHDTLLDQLLLLRGSDDNPPPAYNALLDADNPFRDAAISALAG